MKVVYKYDPKIGLWIVKEIEAEDSTNPSTSKKNTAQKLVKFCPRG